MPAFTVYVICLLLTVYSSLVEIKCLFPSDFFFFFQMSGYGAASEMTFEGANNIRN